MGLHDQLFKNLIFGWPRQALQALVPKEAARIPPNAKIIPLKQSMLKGRLKDKAFELDIPLLVKFPNDEKEILLFCIEENSSVKSFQLTRHAVYSLLLAQEFKTRRVVPVALFPFNKGPIENRPTLAGETGTYLDFRCHVVTLADKEAKAYMNSTNLIERVFLPLMKFPKNKKAEVALKAFDGVVQYEHEQLGQLKLLDFVQHYSTLSAKVFKKFVDERIEVNP